MMAEPHERQKRSSAAMLAPQELQVMVESFLIQGKRRGRSRGGI